MIHSSRSSKRVIYISFPPFFPVFETKLHGSLPSIGTSGQCQVKGLCGNYWIHKWMIKTIHLAPVIQEWPYSWSCTTAKSNLVEMLEMTRNILTLLRVWIFKEGITCYISLHLFWIWPYVIFLILSMSTRVALWIPGRDLPGAIENSSGSWKSDGVSSNYSAGRSEKLG